MFSNIILLDACGCSWWCPWWLIWTAGAMLLGWLLHRWLFCRSKEKEDQILALTSEGDGLRAQLTNVEKDMASLKYQLDEANKDNLALRNALNRCEGDKAGLEAKLATTTVVDAPDTTGLGIVSDGGDAPDDYSGGGGTDYATVLGTDNLQIIEGIGPKIDGLMKEGGVTNWADMSTSSVERLQGILTAAGSRYRLADPGTWPQQAKLAHEGKWDELIAMQKSLDTGKATVASGHETPAKVEKLIAKLLGYSTNPNDLKVVEGIGPKIDGLLKDAGIQNWSDLAAASVDRLKEILAAAGDRYRLADPTTWPKQAELAAAGNWDELRKYQEFLDGGKSPGKS